jgi:hypothetical protein
MGVHLESEGIMDMLIRQVKEKSFSFLGNEFIRVNENQEKQKCGA